MEVVVTGGTGFIGRHLVQALAARGDSVTVLTREPRQAARGGAAGVRFEAWGGAAEGPWRHAVEACDAVIHLAGAPVMDRRWSAARLDELRTSRTKPTAALASAIAKAARVRRKELAVTRPEGARGSRDDLGRSLGSGPRTFISASAVGIYGMRKDDEVLGEEGGHGDDVLASICEDWEAAAAPALDAGVRVLHPRFGIVLGDGGALPKMLPPFRAFMGGPVGDGRQWVSWVHVRDAVRALLFALDEQTFASGPFNVTAPKPVTMETFAESIGEALHRPASVRVPAFAVRLALGDAADAVLSGQRVVPVRLERAGFTFAFDELSPALRELLGQGCGVRVAAE